MLNFLWLALMLIAVIAAFYTGRIDEVAASVTQSASGAFTLCLGLVGVMTFWLGIMKIAEESGFIRIILRGLTPIMRWLFPEISTNHPAMGAMMMNIAANILGLANAATPFGLKAMQELQTLNPEKNTATSAMCLFLAINTSSVQLIPTTAIAYLAAGGATAPTSIMLTALIATSVSTIIAIMAAKTLAKMPMLKRNLGISN